MTHRDPRRLRHADRERDGALRGYLATGKNNLPAAGCHGRKGDAARRASQQHGRSTGSFTGRVPHHVDVTWVPAGWVLMSEQAYTLLSGATRTGLIVS